MCSFTRPNIFIFMQFSAKRLPHPIWQLVPPPQENPGSATDFESIASNNRSFGFPIIYTDTIHYLHYFFTDTSTVPDITELISNWDAKFGDNC